MLEVIKIVIFLQGIFLVATLLANRKKYRRPTFWLLVASILSLLFYVGFNGKSGFLLESIDWFYFDSSFFITFFLLFVMYFVSRAEKFATKHLLFFLPNVFYFIIEGYENYFKIENVTIIEIIELLVELIFFCYLLLAIHYILKMDRKHWMLYFILPISIIMCGALLNEVLVWLNIAEIPYFNEPSNQTTTLMIIAGLFYFMAWKLAVAPGKIAPYSEIKKYRSSGLNENLIEEYSKKIIAFMEDDKGYMNSNLSLPILAQKLDIPKQYISEILNVHLKTNFQDFVNGYRIEAFTKKLNNPEYANLTLVGIAKEVGFNSKSNFYTAFKKAKGITPTEYKKSLVKVQNKS